MFDDYAHQVIVPVNCTMLLGVCVPCRVFRLVPCFRLSFHFCSGSTQDTYLPVGRLRILVHSLVQSVLLASSLISSAGMYLISSAGMYLRRF